MLRWIIPGNKNIETESKIFFFEPRIKNVTWIESLPCLVGGLKMKREVRCDREYLPETVCLCIIPNVIKGINQWEGKRTTQIYFFIKIILLSSCALLLNHDFGTTYIDLLAEVLWVDTKVCQWKLDVGSKLVSE